MIMDIIILVIFVLTVVGTIRKGFFPAICKFVSGILSFIIAYLFCGKAVAILEAKHPVIDNLSDRIARFIDMHVNTDGLYSSIPKVFREAADGFTDKLVQANADKMANILVYILCFVAILIVIRLIVGIFSAFIQWSKDEGGFTGKLDVLLSIIMGSVIGILRVFIFLALFFPVLGVFFPESAGEYMSFFDGSRVALDLYDNNLVLLIMRGWLAKF